MVRQNGSIPTIEEMSSQGFWFSSYQDKYIALDNLDAKEEPVFGPCKEVYNSECFFITIVTHGTLNIKINNQLLAVKNNDYLVVTPCSRIQTMESRCISFSFLVKAHILSDIYQHIGIKTPLRANSFCHHLFHITPQNTEILKTHYLYIKREHQRPDFLLKEYIIRAYTTMFISQAFNAHEGIEETINHKDDSRQYALFMQFLDQLSLQYIRERSVKFYAEKLHITPKYLSSITCFYTGDPASVVIDEYVAFRIKLLLYATDINIKEISQKLNFPTQSFFGRYFKRVTGMSPREYINTNKKKLA